MFNIRNILLSISIFLILIFIIFYTFGFIINTTYSMPLGLYKKVSFKNINRDDIVTLRIPQKSEPLIKKVVGIQNDLVVVNQNGVYINNILQKNSKIFYFDTNGNPIKFAHINKVLNKDELFVLGEHIRSYDSRYFGIINIKANQVKKVKEILVWSNHG